MRRGGAMPRVMRVCVISGASVFKRELGNKKRRWFLRGAMELARPERPVPRAFFVHWDLS